MHPRQQRQRKVKKENVKADSKDYTFANSETLEKYKAAAHISASVLEAVKEKCVAGAAILDLCKLGDQKILEETSSVYTDEGECQSKGICFPTCISVNDTICHYSPASEGTIDGPAKISEGDVVKIALGAQVDGFAANVAETLGIGIVEGRKADVIKAAWEASEAAIQAIKEGAKNWDVTTAVDEAVEGFECTAVEGMLSHVQERNKLDGKKAILLNPTHTQRKDHPTDTFAKNEVYGLDVLVSTGDGKVRNTDVKTTVFVRTSSGLSLRLKASRAFLEQVEKDHPTFPFSLRATGDEVRQRLGAQECAQQGILTQYEVLAAKSGEFVAQFFTTIGT